MKRLYALVIILLLCSFSNAQEVSVARQWNEVVLQAIRNDNARPTIHARNLFHIHAAMYDAWAIFDDTAKTYLIGQDLNGFTSNFNGIQTPSNPIIAQEKAISYACYRMITNRYQYSPNWVYTLSYANALMNGLGFSTATTSTDYSDGDPAKLGNYIAQQYIAYGNQDGSNQLLNYANQYYFPVNTFLQPQFGGNPTMTDINRWQPLNLSTFIDQNGFPGAPSQVALSPEWGNVKPFSLTEADKTVHYRNGAFWNVYKDPGPQPQLLLGDTASINHPMVYGNLLTLLWSSHLTPDDTMLMDISPASICNVPWYPDSVNQYSNFYNLIQGGDPGIGRSLNPITGQPYAPQIVKRGDFTRVLSEYWADGPSSETPPGHWFKILNYVSDHPLFEKRWMGQGEILDNLEWDVRSYLAMGGAMHDAAICAWGIKGYYDGNRPVSVIRKMAENGQSSSDTLPNFHPHGLPLIPGYIELITAEDVNNGFHAEDLNEIKVYAYRGPYFVANTATDYAGVGWIKAKDWWPYQRPTFVTPPFPGYISGHSTYSRTAAELMTVLTGSSFFPGGMGEFFAGQNQYLVFEEGPSTDIDLQWATYQDASDQCSLSRIWGGIHAGYDDIPGRHIGMEMGPQAFQFAHNIQTVGVPLVASVTYSDNIISSSDIGQLVSVDFHYNKPMNTNIIPQVSFVNWDLSSLGILLQSSVTWINNTTLRAQYMVYQANQVYSGVNFRVLGAKSEDGCLARTFIGGSWKIDMVQPLCVNASANAEYITDNTVQTGNFSVTLNFNKVMNQSSSPMLEVVDNQTQAIAASSGGSWVNATTFNAVFNAQDFNEEVEGVSLKTLNAIDIAGNLQVIDTLIGIVSVDTRNPVLVASVSQDTINEFYAGMSLTVSFNSDEALDISVTPIVSYNEGTPELNSFLSSNTSWGSETSFTTTYIVADANETYPLLSPITSATDLRGNAAIVITDSLIWLDTENPTVASIQTTDFWYNESNFLAWNLDVIFSEPMDTTITPAIAFNDPNLAVMGSVMIEFATQWLDASTYRRSYNYQLIDGGYFNPSVDVSVSAAYDAIGNPMIQGDFAGVFGVDIPGAVNENGLSSTMVYPNPANEWVQIKPSHLNLYQFVIYDQVGRVIQTKQGSGVEVIDVSTWSAGVYVIEVVQDGHVDRTKLVVE